MIKEYRDKRTEATHHMFSAFGSWEETKLASLMKLNTRMEWLALWTLGVFSLCGWDTYRSSHRHGIYARQMVEVSDGSGHRQSVLLLKCTSQLLLSVVLSRKILSVIGS